ncbi:Phosphorylase b kinase regulatory subunit alpha [Desmophyllum pertusum]|uniref:Phosphorylase b kinase regulatory subunit n=1 Tax=Desmophyllum pertusum TaxID=174260 RepID=A0A9W9YZ46_9CNID|nr:Phosphorylase b kinase regulatory subunit alpha [Desmophyllum pertusum]
MCCLLSFSVCTQDPVTGLLPPKINWNTYKSGSSDYEDGWVRDNVYSILAVWGLSLAYNKNADMDEDRARAHELTQAVVKCMRGLLMCMMRQVNKVETFKKSQAKEDALHAKYNLKTCSPCVGDHAWGHLQIDATSLYLLMLAEMTASGIQIIFTLDEVAFIQNLVFYIEKAYCIPDYGIWERGDKLNHGMPELNASSIGMAKAALEALDGLDLFGPEGGHSSVIHILPDDIQQCKAILQSMVPRESNSKEIAASVLSVISFPAFAVEDEDLVNESREKIITKLQGRYGLVRFIRDGYKTPLEDPFRLHYEPAELEIFENIECEWPLFYCYLLLDALFNGDDEQVKTYTDLLDPLLVKDEAGLPLVPEFFYVLETSVERKCGEYILHLWSHSLYVLACLLKENFIAVGEIDPLNRRHCTDKRPDVVVQVSLLAEDELVRTQLRSLDVPVQVTQHVNPIQILPARALSSMYQQLGTNAKLKLTGRPDYNIGVLGTSMLYNVGNSILAFSPQILDYHQFYLALDNEFLADRIKSLVGFLGANWRILGRPILTMIITHSMLEDSLSSSIAKMIMKLRSGYISGVRVRLGYLSDFLSTSCTTSLHFIPDSDEELRRHRRNPESHDMLRRTDSESSSTDRTRTGSSSDHNPVKRRPSYKGMVKRSRSISVYGTSPTRRFFHSTSSDTDEEHNLPSATWGTTAVPGCNTFEDRAANGWTPARSRAMSTDMETREYLVQLEEAGTIDAQADILHFLYNTRGPDFDTQLFGGRGITVDKLLGELYEKACQSKLWSLVRHTAGLLRKRVEDLAEAATDLLVHQKQLTVGIPQGGHEEVITRPLPQEEMKNIIFNVFGEDMSTGVVTQELLVYLGIFVRTEPSLFNEMLRLRVGLIIEVMVAELARSLDCSGEDAAEFFMNLSPFEMKTLLYHILSGKELVVSDLMPDKEEEKQISIVNIDLPKRVGIRKLSCAIMKISCIKAFTGKPVNMSGRGLLPSPDRNKLEYEGAKEDEEDPHAGDDRLGQWIRRRCLDGALNRALRIFTPNSGKFLKRCVGLHCRGLKIYQHYLPNAMVQEMTPGELKFALCVEAALNRIPEPEYRQLVVEMLMVLSLVVEYHPEQSLGDTIDVDDLVWEGHNLYLKDQINIKGDSTMCCARAVQEKISCGGAAGICRYFYDTAPSGRFGTMTYFSRVVAKRVSFLPHENECVVA